MGHIVFLVGTCFLVVTSLGA